MLLDIYASPRVDNDSKFSGLWCRGFKGVVQLQPGLQEPFDLQLRPSQEKFKETLLQKQAVFGLVATSLPYKLGNLNKQVCICANLCCSCANYPDKLACKCSQTCLVNAVAIVPALCVV